MEKRSASRSDKSDNATSSRPSSQQQRKQSPPILTAFVSKPKEVGIIKEIEAASETPLNLRKVLQSNKNISPATIQSILAIENEARKELDNDEYTSFQKELFQQNLQNESCYFHEQSSPCFDVKENNGLEGTNIIVSDNNYSYQRERAKEIVAKRKFGKYSNLRSDQLEFLLQGSPLSNPNSYTRAPSNQQAHSYRSLVPYSDAPFIHQPRMILNDPFPGGVHAGRPIMNHDTSYRSMMVNDARPNRAMIRGTHPVVLGQPMMNQNISNRSMLGGTRPGIVGRPVMIHGASNRSMVYNTHSGMANNMNHGVSYRSMVNNARPNVLGQPNYMNHDTSYRSMMVKNVHPGILGQPNDMNHGTSYRSMMVNNARPDVLGHPVMTDGASNSATIVKNAHPGVLGQPNNMNHGTSNSATIVKNANPGVLDQPNNINHGTSNNATIVNNARPNALDQPNNMNHGTSNSATMINNAHADALGQPNNMNNGTSNNVTMVNNAYADVRGQPNNMNHGTSNGATIVNNARPNALGRPNNMNHNTSNGSMMNYPRPNALDRPNNMNHNTSNIYQQQPRKIVKDSRPVTHDRPVTTNPNTSRGNLSVPSSHHRPNHAVDPLVQKRAMMRKPSNNFVNKSLSSKPLPVARGKSPQRAKSPVRKSSSPEQDEMIFTDIMSKMDKAYLSISRPFLPNTDATPMKRHFGSPHRPYSRSYSFTSSSSFDTSSGSDSHETSENSSVS
jgi:hypothetical protein